MAIEWWVVLATLAGPAIAVQTQKFIERATESRRRRLQIFNALMANSNATCRRLCKGTQSNRYQIFAAAFRIGKGPRSH